MNLFKNSIIAIVLVLGYAFAVSEGYVEVKKDDQKLLKSINDLESKIEALGKLTSQAKLSSDISDLNKEVYDKAKFIDTDLNISKILSSFSDISKDSGIELLLFEPKDGLSRGVYSEIPIKIKLRGTFRQTGNFLYQLSKLTYLVVISDLNIKGIISNSGYVINETEAIVSIYSKGA